MDLRLLAWLTGLLGASGVLAGAFGAHALKASVTPERLEVWRTAAHYQQLHAVVLLVLLAWGVVRGVVPSVPAAWCFVAGILVFSGSLYALVLTDLKVLGAITPIGGVLFVAGWLLLVRAVHALPFPGSSV